MRIDAHQHFWHYDPAVQSWISPEMSTIKKDFTPEDLKPHLRKWGFDGCVAVQADTSERDTQFLLSLSEKHDFIKGVVGWLDLKADDLQEKFRQYSEHPKLKGIRHTIQSEAPGFMLDQRFLDGVAALESHGLTYDILISEDQLEEASAMIDRLPPIKMVIDHIAKPNISEGSYDHWSKWMEKISQHDHIHVKLSGMATEADWKTWQPDELKPYTDFCLEKFGPERLMIGSDWPVCLVAGSYDRIIEATTSCLTSLDAKQQEAVMGENAASFYNLK